MLCGYDLSFTVWAKINLFASQCAANNPSVTKRMFCTYRSGSDVCYWSIGRHSGASARVRFATPAPSVGTVCIQRDVQKCPSRRSRRLSCGSAERAANLGERRPSAQGTEAMSKILASVAWAWNNPPVDRGVVVAIEGSKLSTTLLGQSCPNRLPSMNNLETALQNADSSFSTNSTNNKSPGDEQRSGSLAIPTIMPKKRRQLRRQTGGTTTTGRASATYGTSLNSPSRTGDGSGRAKTFSRPLGKFSLRQSEAWN
jgi:hypothetical protein